MARRKRVLWFKFRDHRRHVWRVWLVPYVEHQLHPSGAGGVTDHQKREILIQYINDHRAMCRKAFHEHGHAISGPRAYEGEYKSQDWLLYHAEENTMERLEKMYDSLAGLGFSYPPIPDAAVNLAANDEAPSVDVEVTATGRRKLA